MKYFLIVTVTALVIIIIAQLYFTFNLSKVETHHFVVISQKGNIEIRKYDPAIFISYAETGGMFETQNNSFRNLAGYIFGDNVREQEIAMTTPVQMEEGEKFSVMRFMLPSDYKMNDLPLPNNVKLQMNEDPGFYAATIRYNGFNNENKFIRHKKLLEEFIANEKLESAGEFIFLGYNPPFQWFGRKNEVMVKIDEP